MQETLRLLRGLQEIDIELFRVKDELRRLPEELTSRRGQIDQQRERLRELRHGERELRSKIKEIEDATVMQRQRIRKLETESAGSRADTALIVAYQHEIRSLKREISDAEEEGLGLVERADELAKQAAELQAAIAGAEQDLTELQANVEAEIASAEARRDELGEARRGRMGPMPPEVLVEYEKLLEAREGQAIAALDGRICQGCYVSVPSNIYVRLARGTELVHCPSCGRILYLPDA